MKEILVVSLLVLCLPASLAAQDSGFLSDYSKLEVKPSTGFTRTYISPGAENEIVRITKLMIDQPSFIISEDSKYKAIKPSDILFVAEKLREAVIDGVQGHYPVVEQPGEGVALVRWAITNVRVDKARRGVLSYTPVGLVAYGAKTAMSDIVNKTRAFDIVFEIEVSDSVNDEVLFAATLDMSASGKEVKWGDAVAVSNAIGQRLACRMNNSRLEENDRQDCLTIKVNLGEF